MYKVVHLTSAHPAFDNRILNKECFSLAQAGYQVKLLVPHHRNESVKGVRIIALPNKNQRLQRMIYIPYLIYRRAVLEDADLYHFHDPELIPVGLLLQAQGKTVIYDIHEDVPKNILSRYYLTPALRHVLSWLFLQLERFAARRFSALVAATPTIANRFAGLNRHIEVINNYPWKNEFADIEEVTWEERPNAAVYIGACTRVRGAVEMVRAMNFVAPDLHAYLDIAGHFGPQELQSDLEGEPGWRWINFKGRLKRKEVGQLLGQARVGLVVLHPEPTYIRSQPTKMFEYMAAGIPIVASDFPFWHSIIEERECGLFVNPLDPQEIGKSIEKILRNPIEAKEMGQRGRDAIFRSFNWEREKAKLLVLYSRLL